MRHCIPGGALLLFVMVGAAAGADSIWARREARYAYLFEDNRARRVGDLLTVQIQENTGVNEAESRALAKSTAFEDKLNVAGTAAAGQNLARNGSITYDGAGSSTRSFNGSTAFQSARAFNDIVTVTVIDVMPNGNLVVEGSRSRMVAGELRMLRITGVVRPADIDSANNVGSQFVSNFRIYYAGRGQDTNVNQPSLLKRFLFRVWPN